MENRVNKDVLLRYLSGKHSPSDYHRVRTWFDNSNFEQSLDQAIEDNWTHFEERDLGKDLNTVLQKIQRKIYLDENKNRNTIWNFYRQIAAVLLLPIIVISAFLFINNRNFSQNAWAEIHSPVGARTEFHLPDGTSGWLNSGSSIQYPVNFNVREVKISGEVYFEVTKRNGKLFRVETPALDVVVLGTKFDVTAYKDDQFIEVVLEEGKVKLDGKKKDFSKLLLPNERFVFNSRQNSGQISAVDASVYTSWKEGKLIFHDQPLGEVLKKLGRWYNVQFDVKNKELNDYIYKATFVNETLEEVLRLLAYTAPIKYEIMDRKLKSDGTYSVKKIVIEKK